MTNAGRLSKGASFHERRLTAGKAPMKPQNISTAVMQQRAEPHESLDYFPTPAWATRALCEFLLSIGEPLRSLSCWEPACGEMHMARPLTEFFAHVRATDVHRYSNDHGICDFLLDMPERERTSWIITNPPFMLGQRFIERALEHAARGVAMFVRSAFTEGDERHREIYSVSPPAYVLQFSERVVLLRNRLIKANALDPFNIDPKTGSPRRATTATSYCWLIWIHGQTDTRHRWIGKCRDRLEQPGDYPEYREQWALLDAESDGGLLEEMGEGE